MGEKRVVWQCRLTMTHPELCGQSSRGLEHSKTLRVEAGHRRARQRLGVRRPSAAFSGTGQMVPILAKTAVFHAFGAICLKRELAIFDQL
jgi:hypothetical protein